MNRKLIFLQHLFLVLYMEKTLLRVAYAGGGRHRYRNTNKYQGYHAAMTTAATTHTSNADCSPTKEIVLQINRPNEIIIPHQVFYFPSPVMQLVGRPSGILLPHHVMYPPPSRHVVHSHVHQRVLLPYRIIHPGILYPGVIVTNRPQGILLPYRVAYPRIPATSMPRPTLIPYRVIYTRAVPRPMVAYNMQPARPLAYRPFQPPTSHVYASNNIPHGISVQYRVVDRRASPPPLVAVNRPQFTPSAYRETHPSFAYCPLVPVNRPYGISGLNHIVHHRFTVPTKMPTICPQRVASSSDDVQIHPHTHTTRPTPAITRITTPRYNTAFTRYLVPYPTVKPTLVVLPTRGTQPLIYVPAPAPKRQTGLSRSTVVSILLLQRIIAARNQQSTGQADGENECDMWGDWSACNFNNARIRTRMCNGNQETQSEGCTINDDDGDEEDINGDGDVDDNPPDGWYRADNGCDYRLIDTTGSQDQDTAKTDCENLGDAARIASKGAYDGTIHTFGDTEYGAMGISTDATLNYHVDGKSSDLINWQFLNDVARTTEQLSNWALIDDVLEPMELDRGAGCLAYFYTLPEPSNIRGLRSATCGSVILQTMCERCVDLG